MTLQEWVASQKRTIFDNLRKGLEPEVGTFDAAVLKAGLALGSPQMGTTVFQPHRIEVEFIFSDAHAGTVLFVVHVEAPERIVFLPVPKWVVESIWQGEIAGSHHFESDAEKLIAEFQLSTSSEENPALFGRQMAKRRE